MQVSTAYKAQQISNSKLSMNFGYGMNKQSSFCGFSELEQLDWRSDSLTILTNFGYNLFRSILITRSLFQIPCM